jgi:ATP-dependent Lon protease
MADLIRLPILPLRDPTLVVFPGVSLEVAVGRDFSLEAIAIAQANKSSVIVAMQRDERVDAPMAPDFYPICTEARIECVIPVDEEGFRKRVVITGIQRAHIKVVGKTRDEGSYLYGEVNIIPEPQVEIDDDVNICVTQIYEIISKCLTSITLKNKVRIETSEQLSGFVDHVSSQLPIDGKDRLDLLREFNPRKRLQNILVIIAELSKQVEVDVIATTDEDEDFLDEFSGEVKRLYELVRKADMPEEVNKIASQELRRLKNMPPTMSEFPITANYLEILATLPWNNKTEDKIDIANAEASLNEDHHGLKKPKERILEYLAVRKLDPNKKGEILCFHGPPGTGKTSLGRSIAKAMGRKFIRMSLGGVHDEAEIRGHRRTYVGAMTGKIIQHLRKSEVKNPVFMLDEVDKLSRDYRGDPASALLEVLDPEQNHSFVDNYLNVPFDLSDVLFIGTVNEVSPIPPALRDRMEIIEIPGYSPHDKLKIAQKHLIPKQQEENGLKGHSISFSANSINRIIGEYTSEAGVRSLERKCGTVLRKLAVMVASDKELLKTIRFNSIPRLLGPPKIFAEKASETPEIGLSAGLAWSRNGGSLLFVESSLTPGKGKIKLTGNLGKVLQESASAAHTWIKANAESLGVDLEKLIKSDVHIHFPAGATPKDGPSAGIAVASSMFSLFTDRPIRNDVAMTGEISLRGRILPIGGLIEKILAAHRAGIKQVLFPEQNKHDVEEVPEDVRDDMILSPVSNLREALDIVVMEVDKGEKKEEPEANIEI